MAAVQRPFRGPVSNILKPARTALSHPPPPVFPPFRRDDTISTTTISRREPTSVPSIYRPTSPLNGSKYSENDRRRKRKWYPNYRSFQLPITLLAEAIEAPAGEKMTALSMDLRMKELKEIEEAGGLEAKLISTPAKHLSDEGKVLRGALIERLHEIGELYREEARRKASEAENSASTTLSASTLEAESPATGEIATAEEEGPIEGKSETVNLRKSNPPKGKEVATASGKAKISQKSATSSEGGKERKTRRVKKST